MNNKQKIEKLKALNESVKRAQSKLAKAKKLEESLRATNLGVLLEAELEQAEIILAAKDFLAKLQKMAEDLANMQADSIPLGDNMKETFGPEVAEEFESTVTTALQDGLAAVRAAKDQISTSIMRVEGKDVPDAAVDNDMSGEFDMGDEGADLEGGELDMDDAFGGDASASGPADEPLGRAKKESALNRKRMLEASDKARKIKIAQMKKPSDEKSGTAKAKALNNQMVQDGKKKTNESLKSIGRKLLVNESLNSLVGWLFEEAALAMPAQDFASFAGKVAMHSANDSEALAGWIGQKKYGPGLGAQLSSPLADMDDDILDESAGKYTSSGDEYQLTDTQISEMLSPGAAEIWRNHEFDGYGSFEDIAWANKFAVKFELQFKFVVCDEGDDELIWTVKPKGVTEGKSFKRNDDEGDADNKKKSDKNKRSAAKSKREIEEARKRRPRSAEEDEEDAERSEMTADEIDELEAEEEAANNRSYRRAPKKKTNEGKSFKFDSEEEDDVKGKKKASVSKGDKAKAKRSVEEAVKAIIDRNIASSGKGLAAKAIAEAISKFPVNESRTAKAVERTFEARYGMTPQAYSLKRARVVAEALALNPTDKKNAASAMGKLASQMGADKNLGNKGLSSVMSKMDPKERSTMQKMVNNAKSAGKPVNKVSDFVAAADGELADDKNKNPNAPKANESAVVENWSKGASSSYHDEARNANKFKANADSFMKAAKSAKERGETKTYNEYMVKFNKAMAKYVKSSYHANKWGNMSDAKRDVKKYLDDAKRFESSNVSESYVEDVRCFDTYDECARYALEDSKNGYVQHVEQNGKKFCTSDWYDYETTLGSFSNGRHIEGREIGAQIDEVSTERLNKYVYNATPARDNMPKDSKEYKSSKAGIDRANRLLAKKGSRMANEEVDELGNDISDEDKEMCTRISTKVAEMTGHDVSGYDYWNWLGEEGIDDMEAYHNFEEAAMKLMGSELYKAAEGYARADALLCAIVAGKPSDNDGLTASLYAEWKKTQRKR